MNIIVLLQLNIIFIPKTYFDVEATVKIFLNGIEPFHLRITSEISTLKTMYSPELAHENKKFKNKVLHSNVHAFENWQIPTHKKRICKRSFI